jgi:hypothetical protein
MNERCLFEKKTVNIDGFSYLWSFEQNRIFEPWVPSEVNGWQRASPDMLLEVEPFAILPTSSVGFAKMPREAHRWGGQNSNYFLEV